MYDNYIAPTKKYADLIIHKGVKNTIDIEQLISKINTMNNQRILTK